MRSRLNSISTHEDSPDAGIRSTNDSLGPSLASTVESIGTMGLPSSEQSIQRNDPPQQKTPALSEFERYLAKHSFNLQLDREHDEFTNAHERLTSYRDRLTNYLVNTHIHDLPPPNGVTAEELQNAWDKSHPGYTLDRWAVFDACTDMLAIELARDRTKVRHYLVFGSYAGEREGNLLRTAWNIANPNDLIEENIDRGDRFEAYKEVYNIETESNYDAVTEYILNRESDSSFPSGVTSGRVRKAWNISYPNEIMDEWAPFAWYTEKKLDITLHREKEEVVRYLVTNDYPSEEQGRKLRTAWNIANPGELISISDQRKYLVDRWFKKIALKDRKKPARGTELGLYEQAAEQGELEPITMGDYVILGTDIYNDTDIHNDTDLIWPQIKKDGPEKYPLFMTGRLYNLGRDWNAELNKKFITEIIQRNKKAIIYHREIYRNVRFGLITDETDKKFDNIAKSIREIKNGGTPNEVATLIEHGYTCEIDLKKPNEVTLHPPSVSRDEDMSEEKSCRSMT